MFYVPLYHFTVSDWNIKQRLFEIYQRTNLLLTGNVHTDYHDTPNYQHEVREIFEHELNIFFEDVNERYDVTDAWFETSLKRNHHPVHDHGSFGFSAVYYLKYDSEHHTPTHFISPFRTYDLRGNMDSYMQYKPRDIMEGSLIIFPANILHYTLPNNSDTERIILSFNLK